MARYATFKYGSGQKYGEKVTDNLLWPLQIDWDNDGVFDGSNEAARLKAFRLERGRAGLFTTGGRGEARLARMQPGRATFTLENHDGRYDLYNASSPLYPDVAPGREVKFEVQNGSAGSTYALFRGRIDDIQCDEGLAYIYVSDGWRMLADRKVITELREAGTTDLALGDVLDAAGWPAAWGRNLGAGADTIPYFWADDVLAYEALHDLAESEFGFAWVGADGAFNFTSRHELVTQAAALALDQSEVDRKLRLSQPWDSVKNYIRVQAHPRQPADYAPVWQLSEASPILPGQTVTWWAKFVDSLGRPTPATLVTLPLLGVTLELYDTDADTGGVDISLNFDIETTVYGGSAKIVLTNNGPITGYPRTGLIIAKSLEDLFPTAAIAEDAASQAAYGVRQLTLDLPYQQNTFVANDLAYWLSTWHNTPQPSLPVEMVNRPTIQFAHDLGALVDFTSAARGIDRRFRIGRVIHQSLGGMQEIKTTWNLEPIQQPAEFWQLGEVGHSEIGETTALVY